MKMQGSWLYVELWSVGAAWVDDISHAKAGCVGGTGVVTFECGGVVVVVVVVMLVRQARLQAACSVRVLVFQDVHMGDAMNG